MLFLAIVSVDRKIAKLNEQHPPTSLPSTFGQNVDYGFVKD
ncbi:1096_t:CDS:2 [Ambispora gerdemannii]|uniref:1096_t:CDS:1 n=1 Tax=Ambispora gerdemannii TaxID=144530 RepID=A0A9N8W6Q6_9GLOM|nr:1096_t:CDS:2 [Ambispora gerdemannii]